MLMLSCTNEQKIRVTATPVTSTGRPATLDGNVTVSVVSGDSTFNLLPPNSFELISSDTPGATTFLVEADADLGAGVVLIQDTITLDVMGALAVNLGLTAGAPEAK